MVPLFTVEQIRSVDKYAIENLGIPGLSLMENASKSIFDIVMEKYNPTPESPIGFICGKGNNGGDGFAAARHFVNHNYSIKIIYLEDAETMSSDARKNYEILKKLAALDKEIILKKYKSSKDIIHLKDCTIIFDAMLGSGSTGILKSPYSEIITEVNSFHTTKVAIDIPTGLDADTGWGEIIFQSDLTISLAELKRGLFINKGSIYCGEVVKGYIGTPEKYFDQLEIEDYLSEPEDAFKGIPARKKDYHKYSAGKVLVLAGSSKLPGAAFFTAQAGLISGAGSVILSFPKSLKLLAQTKMNEVIVETYDDQDTGIFRNNNYNDIEERLTWMDVLAIGPGMGRKEQTAEGIRNIVSKNKNKRIIIDADGVFALAYIEAFREMDLRNCILTPHHSEFANLIGIDIVELKKDILEFGKTFVSENECFLVLKGAPTIIFNPEGEAFVNTTGNSGMAKFGTGDILTGIIAGFLSQSKDIEDALISAVYLHSLSADLLAKEKTEYGYVASDILDNFPYAMNFLRKSIA